MIDPWGGYNQGVATLNDTMNNIRTTDRQATIDAQNSALARQQLAMGDIKLTEAQRQTSDLAELRRKLAGVEPQTVTTIKPAPATPQAPVDSLGMRSALTGNYGQTNQPAAPGTGSLDESMQSAGLAEQPPADASGFKSEGIAPSPTVQAYNEGRVSSTTKTAAQQQMQILIDHAMKTGDIDKATGAISLEGILAKHKAELETGNGDIAGYVKSQMDLAASKDLINTVAPLLLKGEAGRNLAARYLAGAKAANPNNPVLQGATVDDFGNSNGTAVQAVRDPQTGQVLGHYILNPQKGELEFKQSNSAEMAHNSVEIPSPDGKTAQKFQYNTGTQKYDIPIGPAYAVKSQVPNVNVKVNASTPDAVTSDAQAILNGTLAPKDLSKRNGHDVKVRQEIRSINPNFDFIKADAGAKFSQSQQTMQTQALLNTIDPLLGKLEQAGAVLGNSSVPGYNKAVNYLKEQTGQSDIVGFNNLRDDVVAEVERGLLGTGVLSDSKYNRAIKNINSAQSTGQLKAAIANTRTVISARLESLAKGPNANTPQSGQPIVTKGGFKVTVN